MESIKYYSYSTTPAFDHDCHQCKFITCIKREDGFTIDLYQSCEGSDDSYLIRYSNEWSDYSTPQIRELAIHYVERMKGK